MKFRRHHNNDGRRQIQRGKTRKWVAALKRRLGINGDSAVAHHGSSSIAEERTPGTKGLRATDHENGHGEIGGPITRDAVRGDGPREARTSRAASNGAIPPVCDFGDSLAHGAGPVTPRTAFDGRVQIPQSPPIERRPQ